MKSLSFDKYFLINTDIQNIVINDVKASHQKLVTFVVIQNVFTIIDQNKN